MFAEFGKLPILTCGRIKQNSVSAWFKFQGSGHVSGKMNVNLGFLDWGSPILTWAPAPFLLYQILKFIYNLFTVNILINITASLTNPLICSIFKNQSEEPCSLSLVSRAWWRPPLLLTMRSSCFCWWQCQPCQSWECSCEPACCSEECEALDHIRKTTRLGGTWSPDNKFLQ